MDFTKIVELLDNEKRKLFSQALLLLGPTERSPVPTVASKPSSVGPAVVNESPSPGED